MPYISEKIKLPRKLDRRVKLDDDQKEAIKDWFVRGISMRKIAKEFNVDKGTVRNIVKPEAYQAQLKKYREEKHWQKYYDTAKNTVYMRNHRRYKQELYLKGKLKKEDVKT